MRKLEVLFIMALLGAIVFPILFSATTPSASATTFPSGSGTVGDPWIIENVEQLQAMKDNLTAYYALGNDIDASATRTWNDNGDGGYYGFEPIKNVFWNEEEEDWSYIPFVGSLDGRGHKIENLYINRPDNWYIGLFGYVGSGGVMENVGLENENVSGYVSVGGLTGWNYGTVTNCYSTGAITGAYDTGGFIGQNTGTVTNSYSTSSASSDGGCYVGGFIGWYTGGVATNCYSTGVVSGNSTDRGGLIGLKVSGTVSNSFWDNQTSGQTTSSGGTGKTTENMKNVRTYTDTTWSVGLTAPWDFVGNPYGDTNNENIWVIHSTANNGYPILTVFGIINTPPATPTILTLNSPKVGETLTAIASGSTDADGDSIENYYKFYNQTNSATRQDWSTTNTYTIQTIDAHDNIIVYARANDGYENSPSDIENSIIVSNTAPTIPTDFTDLGMNLTDHTPTITWTKGTDADGDTVTTYVYVGTTTTPTTEETHNTGTGCDLGTTVTLSDGTVYYYRLRSWDGYEYSSYTTVDQFRMNTPPSNPTTWTNLGENLTDTTPTITWSGQSDTDGDTATVYVYVGITSAPTVEEGNATSSTLDLGSAVILANGTAYYYRLRSYDGYEFNGSYTTADHFSIIAPPPDSTIPIVENLKTDAQTNPTALVFHNPTFSWGVSDNSYMPSSNLLFENTAEVSTTSSTPVLVFQYTLGYSGSLRIDFALANRYSVWGIYKNGVWLMGEQTMVTGYTTYTENIAGWSVGDNVQLYISQNLNYTTYAKNFRVYGSFNIPSYYEVWVGTTSGSSNKWASAQIASTATSAVYAGSTLSVNTTYYVQVRSKNLYNWSTWTTGTFKMVSSYNIRLRWEENNENANVNATLTGYMGTYGTQENTITAGHLENLTYPERPYWMQLTYGGYYRSYIPTTDNGTIYFYITDSSNLTGYIFALVDLTGMYGQNFNGSLTISKMFGTDSVIICSAPWQADATVQTFLIKDSVYRITVKSDAAPTRIMGNYTVGLISPIYIQVGALPIENAQQIYDHIYWLAYRDNSDNTIIRAIYLDDLDGTTSATVDIYDNSGALVYEVVVDNSDFAVAWLNAEPTQSYYVILRVTHSTLGTFTHTTPIPAAGAYVIPPPTDGEGIPINFPLPLTAIVSLILMSAVGLAFDAPRAHLAAIAMALTATGFFAIGWLPVIWYTCALVLLLAVFFALSRRRVR